MNELLPIIRRKRRPLLSVDVVPLHPAAVTENDKTDVTHGTELDKKAEPIATAGEPKASDDAVS